MPFLQSRGAYSIAETYLTQAQQATTALEDNANLTVTYLHLGRIADLSGDYDKAEQFYREGLRLARAVEQRGTFLQGNLTLAYQYGAESLQLFQNMEHEEANRVEQWLQQTFF